MMPRFKQTIERAARLVGPTDEIDTDHLLLGIMQVRGALATTLLEKLGVGEADIRASVAADRREAS
jgi:hypothetical protein